MNNRLKIAFDVDGTLIRQTDYGSVPRYDIIEQVRFFSDGDCICHHSRETTRERLQKIFRCDSMEDQLFFTTTPDAQKLLFFIEQEKQRTVSEIRKEIDLAINDPRHNNDVLIGLGIARGILRGLFPEGKK